MEHYLTSDLVAELQLPRSTVADWLGKYGDYLETENRGKRKFYTPKSLAVLREIAELRKNGKSPYEVEQFLASRYGLRGEVADEHESEDPASLPVLRPAFDQMSIKINSEFSKLAERIAEAEKERAKLMRRVWLTTVVLVVGIGALIVVALFLSLKFYNAVDSRAREQAASLTGQLNNFSTEQSARAVTAERKMAEMALLLDRSQHEFKDSLARLKEEMGSQRKAFAEQLNELENNSASRSEAEIARLREEFARRQLAELEKLSQEYEQKLRAEREALSAKALAEQQQFSQREEAYLNDLRRREEEIKNLNLELAQRREEAARLAEEEARKSVLAASPEPLPENTSTLPAESVND